MVFGAFTAISALNTTLASGRATLGGVPPLPDPPRKRFQHLRDWWPVYACAATPLVVIAVFVVAYFW